MFSKSSIISPVLTTENKDSFVDIKQICPWVRVYGLKDPLHRPEHYTSYFNLDKPIYLRNLCDVEGYAHWTDNHFINGKGLRLSRLLFEVSSKNITQVIELDTRFFNGAGFYPTMIPEKSDILKMIFSGLTVRPHMFNEVRGNPLDVFKGRRGNDYINVSLNLDYNVNSSKVEVIDHQVDMMIDNQNLKAKLLGYYLFIPVDINIGSINKHSMLPK